MNEEMREARNFMILTKFINILYKVKIWTNNDAFGKVRKSYLIRRQDEKKL